MTTERYGDFTIGGKPFTVLGDALKPGDQAPDFRLMANDLSTVTLADSAGKVRLISVVPSLGTSVCSAQTRRINEEAVALNDDVVVLTVSVDIPFAQKSWCGAEGIERVQTLSDNLDMNFGDAYGTHVKEVRWEQRSVFVIDADDKVTYVDYVVEMGHQPDYDAAIAAVRAAVA